MTKTKRINQDNLEVSSKRTSEVPSRFLAMLINRWEIGNFVCVGLDSDYAKIPACVKTNFTSVSEAIFQFNRAIIDATVQFVCAFKPNSAFYEARGEEGLTALRQTVLYIHEKHPGIAVILDAKRGDIGSTNDGYVASIFDDISADAVTLNPYLGKEALEPFLKRVDKGLILLARTSNPGAGRFQDLKVGSTGDPLYLTVARDIAENWNENGNCALVAGATYPNELAQIRSAIGDLPILIPGVGAQGADVKATVVAGKNSKNMGMIINSSRGIIFASGNEDFAQKAKEEAGKLRDEINKYRI